MNINNKMKDVIDEIDIDLTLDIELDGKLQCILDNGFSEVENCIYFNYFINNSNLSRISSMDKTGKECFINHLHIDDFIDEGKYDTKGIFLQSISFCKMLNKQLHDNFPKYCFIIIMSCDGFDCSIRFHKKRSGENWLSNNINDYGEGVLAIDVDG